MAFPVKARQNTPPVTPSVGDRYLIGTTPTGAWFGYANLFTTWFGASWSFRPPAKGEEVYLQDTDEWLFYNGTAWVAHPFLSTTTPVSTYLTPGSLGSFLTRANIDWGNQGTGDNAVIETIVSVGERPYWNWRITHPGSPPNAGNTTSLQTRREWDLAGGALASGEFVEIATMVQLGEVTTFYLRNPSSNVAVRVREDTDTSILALQRLTGFNLTNNGTVAANQTYYYPSIMRPTVTFFRLRRNGNDIELWTSIEGTVFALLGAITLGSDASNLTRIGTQLWRSVDGHCSVTWLKLTRA